MRCVSRRGAGVPSQRHRLTKRGFTCTRKRSAVEKGGFAFILFICLLIKVGEEDSWSEGSHSRLEGNMHIWQPCLNTSNTRVTGLVLRLNTNTYFTLCKLQRPVWTLCAPLVCPTV